MTLVEKQNYPVIILIKNYDASIIYQDGNQTTPKVLTSSSEYTWEGLMILRTQVDLDLVDSRTNEIIDKINFTKDYRSKGTLIKMPHRNSISIDTREDAIHKSLNDFTNDLADTIDRYDWRTIQR
jgi:hypothetical protein